MKYLALLWSNLKRKKLRTALTLLSIFIAFLLFGVLCTIKESFTAGISVAGADRLIVRHKVSLIMSLPITYGARMQRIPGVDATTDARPHPMRFNPRCAWRRCRPPRAARAASARRNRETRAAGRPRSRIRNRYPP